MNNKTTLSEAIKELEEEGKHLEIVSKKQEVKVQRFEINVTDEQELEYTKLSNLKLYTEVVIGKLVDLGYDACCIVDVKRYLNMDIVTEKTWIDTEYKITTIARFPGQKDEDNMYVKQVVPYEIIADCYINTDYLVGNVIKKIRDLS